MSNQSDTRIVLLGADAPGGVMTGVTTGTSVPVSALNHNLLTFYIAVQGTATAGAIILEEADYAPREGPPYKGTWSQIQSVTAPVTPDTQVAVPLGPRVCGYVRARIGTAIVGGTASVVLRMN